MTQHLFLFQIGPVQSFIAAARRTQDLYVGSRILSILAESGVWVAANHATDFLFPMPLENDVFPKSVPHRFAFITNDSDLDVVAKKIEKAIKDKWYNIAIKVKDWLVKESAGTESNWPDIFEKQVESWLEFNWVAVIYDPHDHGGSYIKAVRALASRKMSREIIQVAFHPEEVNTKDAVYIREGQKCTLSGAQAALDLDWQAIQVAVKEILDADEEADDIVIRDNEVLGSLATIKRFAGERFARIDGIHAAGYPSTTEIAGGRRTGKVTDEPLYFAVLHMDGDNMGTRLSQFSAVEAHQNFSRQLANFADNLDQFIQDKVRGIQGKQKGKGRLIYSGGDDVLALLPLWAVLPVADAIRQKFAAEIGGTMSAGISITPHKHPFSFALEEARIAEEHAKQLPGKNAIAIRQNVGQIREAIATWDAIWLVTRLQELFTAHTVSGKLGFDLLNLAQQLAEGDPATDPLHPAMSLEADRILKRRIIEPWSKEAKQGLCDELQLGQHAGLMGWERLANWIIIARFLSGQARQERELETEGHPA